MEELTRAKDNFVTSYAHCPRCIRDIQSGEWKRDKRYHHLRRKGISPQAYAHIEFGYTPFGLQIRCVRHDCSLAIVDLKRNELDGVQFTQILGETAPCTCDKCRSKTDA